MCVYVYIYIYMYSEAAGLHVEVQVRGVHEHCARGRDTATFLSPTTPCDGEV